METWFHELADWIHEQLRPGEDFLCGFNGERSDFVRMNHARVRQAGSVVQRTVRLDWISGLRHGPLELALSGRLDEDQRRLAAAIDALRAALDQAPEDPHLHFATEPSSSRRVGASALPAAEEAVEAILRAAAGQDLVGIYAAGPVYRGFANSLGQRNWLEQASFHLDWSLYARGDKAVKCTYAGLHWDSAELDARMARARAQVPVLQRPARTIEPGPVRAFLAPAAVREILALLSWGGFGLSGLKTRESPLLALAEGKARLDPRLQLTERLDGSLAPDFDARGFRRPAEVPLVKDGTHAGALVSPRSAKEYGVDTTGAGPEEDPEALEMAAGDLPTADALQALGTGVLVQNLWYLNYSDRPACRITGMTRFATLWVENGEIVAPLNVMRFDESLFDLWGEKLVDLTRERELILDTDTYFHRKARSMRVPGTLVEGLTFTL